MPSVCHHLTVINILVSKTWAQFSMSLVPVFLHNWIKKGPSICNMSGAKDTATAVKPADSENDQSHDLTKLH